MVCFDESPKQLIGEVREAIPLQPGTPARQDTEYQRNGVRDLMMICEPKRGWREVLVMERRTKIEFAHCMRHIVQCYPCLLYTSPSPRDRTRSRMPSSA